MKIYIPIFNTKIFDLQSFGYYAGNIRSSQTTLIYSLALTYHPRIKTLIEKKQEHLIGFPYPYPEKRDFKLLHYIQKDLKEEIINYVSDASTEILNTLGWGRGWKEVIMAKIYTNVLPVPSDSSMFSFVKANEREFRKGEGVEDGSKSLVWYDGKTGKFTSVLDAAMEFAPRIENLNFPFIVIKERLTSKKPLIDFINQNFDKVIQPATEILPTRKHRKANIERFMISLWMFELLHNQNKKPKEVEKMIQEKDPGQTMYANYDMTSTGISKLADEAKIKLEQIYPL